MNTIGHEGCSESTEAVLDPALLAGVRADAGDDLFAKLVMMFDEEQAKRVDLLRAALDQDDRKSIVFQAHVLRGAGAQLGAARLSAIAAQLEREAVAAGPIRLTRLVSEVIALSASSFAALRQIAKIG